MNRQYGIPLDSAAAWKKALGGISHTFGHTWENCYAMHLTTGLATYLYCFESDDVRIVCPIAEREMDGYVDIVKPFGFSGFVGNGDSPELRHSWEEFARQRNYVCGYLGLNPIFDYSCHFKTEDVHRYDTVHILDLNLSIEELWTNMSTNRKRQLRDWDAIAENLEVGTPELRQFFLATYREFFSSKGAEQVYQFSEETLSYLFGLENVFLVGARISGKVEAVSVFAYTADAGDYLFNVSLPGGKDHTAALIWYGVNYLKSRNIPVLNLGGGGGGVGESKRRYGGSELPLQCIKQIYDRQTYRELCSHVQADPENVNGYFPAYRKNG